MKKIFIFIENTFFLRYVTKASGMMENVICVHVLEHLMDSASMQIA